jgi:hypothetical protein
MGCYLHADAHLFLNLITLESRLIKMEPISELTDFSYDFQDWISLK